VDLGKESNIKENPDEVLSKLAETFFIDEKTKIKQLPTKVEKPSKRPAIKISPWIILFIVTIFFLALYIANARIDININFPEGKSLGEISKAFFKKSSPSGAQKDLWVYSKKGINYDVVKNIEFSSSAIEEDIGKYLRVSSGKEQRSACVYFGFKTPLDLGRHRLVFNAKGHKGGEELMVIFRDAMYRSRQIKVAERGLTPDWREFFIDLDNIGVINAGQIKDVRFEFGHSMTNNPPGTVIFLKDIYFAVKTGTGWSSEYP